MLAQTNRLLKSLLVNVATNTVARLTGSSRRLFQARSTFCENERILRSTQYFTQFPFSTIHLAPMWNAIEYCCLPTVNQCEN